MITISGKNFSFQATHMKAGSSITISSSGGIKFNNVALEAKMQSAEKIDQNQSKKGSNAGYSNNVPSRSDTKDIKPEVTRGKPFPGGEPPRVVEPLPKAPEVINLVPAEGIVLGDALDPPNGEFQIAGSPSRNEPTRNIPRDIVRFPSLDNTRFVETDLSRELKAEAEGAFDQELISATGLQPEVARPAPLEKPQGNIPRDIVRVPSLDNIQFVETDLSRELKAENDGGFDQELISLTGLRPEVASSAPLEKPQGNIPRDIVRVPSLDNIQFVETDLSRQLAADQKLDSKTNDEAKTNLFNFKITT